MHKDSERVKIYAYSCLNAWNRNYIFPLILLLICISGGIQTTYLGFETTTSREPTETRSPTYAPTTNTFRSEKSRLEFTGKFKNIEENGKSQRPIKKKRKYNEIKKELRVTQTKKRKYNEIKKELRVTQTIALDVFPPQRSPKNRIKRYFDNKLQIFLRKGKQMCITCPVSLRMENRRILDWIAYHSILGVDCFILLLDRKHIVNQPEAHTNKSTVLNLLYRSPNVKLFAPPLYSTDLRLICSEYVIESLRSLGKSKYAMYMDSDEYVVLRGISANKNMPGALLRALENIGETSVYLNRHHYGTSNMTRPPPFRNYPGIPDFSLYTEKLIIKRYNGKILLHLNDFGTKRSRKDHILSGMHACNFACRLKFSNGSRIVAGPGSHYATKHLKEALYSLTPRDRMPISINHYYTWSLEECLTKAKLTHMNSGGHRSQKQCYEFNDPRTTISDPIIAPFGPIVRNEVAKLIAWSNRWPVVLITVSRGFDEIFRNWWRFFIALRLPMTVIMAAEDIETFKRYDGNSKFQGLTVWPPVYQSGKIIPETSSYFKIGSAHYATLVSRRAAHMLRILDTFPAVIYSDIDAIWYRDPRPFLSGSHDFWAQMDHKYGRFCTGFLAFRKSSPSGVGLLRRWDDELAKKSQKNQPLFNRLIHEMTTEGELGASISLEPKPLDTDIFIDGTDFVRRIARNRNTFVLAHNNHARRKKEIKIRRFKETGLWDPVPA